MTLSADFLRGFFTAIVLMFLVWLVRWFWGEISKMWKRQVVIHVTDKTPMDIVLSSFGHLLLGGVAIGGGVLFLGLFRWSLPMDEAVLRALIAFGGFVVLWPIITNVAGGKK